MFRKKKKEKEIEEPEEQSEEEQEEELPQPPKPPRKVKKIQAEAEPKGEFSLTQEEMALAVNALASSEEFKLYQQMVLGQRIAEIITAYQKAVGGKEDEVLSSEDTDEEEELPQPR